MNLTPWFSEIPRMRCILCISGTDDVALVEISGCVRVFSLAMQQFR